MDSRLKMSGMTTGLRKGKDRKLDYFKKTGYLLSVEDIPFQEFNEFFR